LNERVALLVVLVLGILAIFCISGQVVLVSLGHEPPAALAGATGTIVGFLVGLPVRVSSSTAQQRANASDDADSAARDHHFGKEKRAGSPPPSV
jgi:hypothetical protein